MKALASFSTAIENDFRQIAEIESLSTTFHKENYDGSDHEKGIECHGLYMETVLYKCAHDAIPSLVDVLAEVYGCAVNVMGCSNIKSGIS